MLTLLFAAAIALQPFGDVKVVDVIDCTKSDHRFVDWPKGSSRVETVLGKPCRVLGVQSETASYLDWRLGEGKGLKPNAAYVVVIEYPDDKPRAFHVRNYGNNSRRSFYTGASNGDAFEGPIVHHKPESLKIPQSGKYEKWMSLTFLGEKASNLRDLNKKDVEKSGVKHQLDIATDGFTVAVGQYCRKWHPGSAGVAVGDPKFSLGPQKRAQFMDDIRKYLEENGVKNAIAILENDDSETGYPLADGGSMTTDDLAYWKEKLPGKKIVDVNDPSVVGQHRYLKSLRTPASTWGPWEWQHASPACDPEHYSDLKNVWIAMPFHALFTVTDPECFSAFGNASGTQTLIRHYDLNEGTFDSEPLLDPSGNPVKNGKGEVEKAPITGYAMADWEHAGSACMIAEINAMANGDPVNLGYLMGSNYTRGFPGPVREFNQNFLALPALPSKVVKGACSDSEVVLREIDCSKFGVTSKYYALVHIGWTEKCDVKVAIPGVKGEVEFVANGKTSPLTDGALVFKALKPLQLIAIKSK